MPVCHFQKELLSNLPKKTWSPSTILRPVAGRLGFATSRARLRLGGEVNNDLTIIAPAHRAGTMRYAHSPTLTLCERLGLYGVVRAARAGLRPVVPHSDYHGPYYSIGLLKEKDPPCRLGLTLQRVSHS